MCRSQFSAFLGILVFAVLPVSAQTVIDFEDMTSGTRYYVGQSFQSHGIAVDVEALSSTYLGGSCEVLQRGYTGGSGNELATWNTMLHFGLAPASQISLLYGYYGGYMKIEVNGDTRQLADVLSVNGLRIGGVDAVVTQSVPSGNARGSLRLTGPINSFAIGGQEFAIDDVTVVTEPSAALSLVLGLSAMAGIRMRQRR